jgi:F420-non-reducing hydrogenase iron-sulfur subunit
MRLQYPDSIRIIRIPCTGKVDIIHLLKAMEKGADGAYVVGCLEGECRFENGNLRARKRVEHAQEILEKIGIGGERVQMYNISSGEGPRFAEAAREMTEKIMEMGPNPMKKAKKKAA